VRGNTRYARARQTKPGNASWCKVWLVLWHLLKSKDEDRNPGPSQLCHISFISYAIRSTDIGQKLPTFISPGWQFLGTFKKAYTVSLPGA